MRLFGGDSISGLMTKFNMPEDVPLSHSLVSRAIEQAQVKVEGYNFDIRKHLVDYDDVLNKQREIIYSRRRKILLSDEKSEALKTEILEKVRTAIETSVMVNTQGFEAEKSPNQLIAEEFSTIIPFDSASIEQITTQLEQIKNNEEKTGFLLNIAKELYEKREKDMSKELARQLEKYVMLSVIDNLWVDHLDAVDNLRQGIGLRGYGQKDPLVEYKNEAFGMFDKLINAIDDEVVHRIYKMHVHSEPQPESPLNAPGITQSAAGANFNSETSSGSRPAANTKPAETSVKKKLGRNDPCWCGSGKKYKKCHYPN